MPKLVVMVVVCVTVSASSRVVHGTCTSHSLMLESHQCVNPKAGRSVPLSWSLVDDNRRLE